MFGAISGFSVSLIIFTNSYATALLPNHWSFIASLEVRLHKPPTLFFVKIVWSILGLLCFKHVNLSISTKKPEIMTGIVESIWGDLAS